MVLASTNKFPLVDSPWRDYAKTVPCMRLNKSVRAPQNLHLQIPPLQNKVYTNKVSKKNNQLVSVTIPALIHVNRESSLWTADGSAMVSRPQNSKKVCVNKILNCPHLSSLLQYLMHLVFLSIVLGKDLLSDVTYLAVMDHCVPIKR